MSGLKRKLLRMGHRKASLARIQSATRVLVVQDTTEFNFTRHVSKQGLGYLDHAQSYGIKAHSAMAVSEQGLALGIVQQQVWARDKSERGKAKQRDKRAIEDKESYRWLETMQAVEKMLGDEQAAVVIGDRESDIFELFAQERRQGLDFLVRARHNRRVKASTAKLWKVLENAASLGSMTVSMYRAKDDLPETFEVVLRMAQVELEAPKSSQSKETVTVTAILVEGLPKPWLLLTSLLLINLEEVKRCVRYYSLRWLIERYHYVLKSGCRLEQLQLASAERTEKALAVCSIVAWRLLWLTQQARLEPNKASDDILESYEWQALYATIHNTKVMPKHPPSLQLAIRWIAQLGGFLARKHDKQPGVTTLWRGLRRLTDIADTWKLIYA